MGFTPTEREILADLIVNGDNAPSNIAENIGRAREHVNTCLANLEDEGMVENKGSGVWKLTATGAILGREFL